MATPKSHCLILASSLHVADPKLLRPSGVIDPAERADDTRRALSFWLTRQDWFGDLVLVDNSGADLGQVLRDLPAAPGRHLEVLSFDASADVACAGRSYGELAIMRYAITHSEVLAGNTHFAKVNARLRVGNLDALMRVMPDDHDAVARLSHNLTWLSTPFVAFGRSFFYNKILPYALDHADDSAGVYIEHAYASALLRAVAEGARWYPFSREPDLIGRRGLDGTSYRRGALRRWLIDLGTRGYHRAHDTRSGET